MTTETARPLDGRERRKIATRRALRKATLDLGLQRGLGDVPVEEIATRAGVSTRTFFNYFDTKEDAALIELFSISDAELDALAGGAAPDTVWQELTELLLADVARVEHEGPDLPRYMALHAANPGLQARQQGRFFEFVVRLSEAVETRLGDRPQSRLRAGLMAGSCLTAVRVGLEQWALAGWEGSGRHHVTAAFAVFDPVFGSAD